MSVTLSYLASGFDWQANYIATLAPSGDRLHLFAWVTLANGDETTLRDAAAQTVAGRLNREERFNERLRADALHLQCWPQGTTGDILLGGESAAYPPPPPLPALMMSAPETIIVTGSRIRRAVQEDLGDLKLYRIPEPVTVASHSQKQVAMMDKEGVKVRSVYRQRLSARSPTD